MYNIDLKKSLPTSNNLLFQNRETKFYVHVDLNIFHEKVEAVISESKDGINTKFPISNNQVVDTLPDLAGNLVEASLTVIQHFKGNGYVLVNTITPK